jgi:hypothetical protein
LHPVGNRNDGGSLEAACFSERPLY